jgi:TolB-like protein/class 3 adenylate cyclase
MSETRKLAAILVSDVVGYSRLAGADEDRTLARLRALRSDLIDPIISVHHGRIVKRTGDGSIIEFRSVVDAVRCAIEVQSGMVERNAGLPAEKRIEFRVGIHLGDVVEEADGDLMGDGVNIAARLEGICEPGAVCLSEDAYRQVSGRLDMAVADLGPTQLKNIERSIRVYSLQVGVPVHAKPAIDAKPSKKLTEPKKQSRLALIGGGIAALLILVAAGAWYFLAANRTATVATKPTPEAPRLSIVVLPFENLSGDKEQDYFADGITEDLTTDLSHVFDFVIARNTAFTYKGKPVDAKQIGRELGVKYLLEGSVRRVGETITINAQLISTETGAHVWADRFEGERSKLGALQVEAVSRLANSLGVELVKAEALRAMRERPKNPDAVDLAMRGTAIMNGTESLASVNEAIGLFERALSLDPHNVQALLGLSWALSDRAGNFADDNGADHLARAEQAVDAALAIQPDNSSAHTTKSGVYWSKHQWGPAIAEAEKAIADDRNNAWAHASLGIFKNPLGHAEDGFAEVETALRLSPRDPGVTWWQFWICHFHSHLGQWEKAIEWCNKSVASGNQTQWPYADLAAAHAWLGHMKEAKEAAAQVLKYGPDFTIQGWMESPLKDHWNGDPTFKAQLERIGEGARKAGVPEGEKKTD